MATDTVIQSELDFVAEALQAEIAAIQRLMEHAGQSIPGAVDIMEACTGHVVVTGMGKSGLIAQKISATLSSIGVPSNFIHPAEAVHGDLGRIRRDDVLWALSYSGNTEEVVALATLVKTDGLKVISISSNPKSRLAAVSDVHLSIGDVTEACPLNLAPTASTTATLALGDAVSLAVSRRKSFTEEDYRKHHPGGMLGTGLRSITEILRFHVGDNLPITHTGVTVRHALDIASKGRRPGALVIVDAKGKLAGIFTDGDLRRLVLDQNHDAPLECLIEDVMTHNPRSLPHTALVRDTVQLVRQYRQDEIPVVDDEGKPVGLVDVQDLIAMKVIDG